MNNNLLKSIGLVGTIAGFGVTLISNWVSEQQLNNLVEEKVEEALSRRDEDEEF